MYMLESLRRMVDFSDCCVVVSGYFSFLTLDACSSPLYTILLDSWPDVTLFYQLGGRSDPWMCQSVQR